MPLKSATQAAYLEHNHPSIYKEFAAATPKGTKLPHRAPKAKRPSIYEKPSP
jgi:hypothetical protein